LLSIGFNFKQTKKINDIENAFYGVSISNSIINYRTYSLDHMLSNLASDEDSSLIRDNSLGKEFLKLSHTYDELFQYYLTMNSNNVKVNNDLTDILQDFSSFFTYLFELNNDEVIIENKELQDDAFEGIQMIAEIVKDLEEIRSEVYQDKATDHKQAWEILVVKNEEYVQFTKTQQNIEQIQQMIKNWAEKVNP